MSGNMQAASVITRALNIHAEIDDKKADLRDLYGEAKSNGFDKTALGAAVNRIRKRDAGKLSDVENAEIERDLLIAAYDASGTALATHTHEE
jgi:uncharacterized protein (UPF0335 family)